MAEHAAHSTHAAPRATPAVKMITAEHSPAPDSFEADAPAPVSVLWLQRRVGNQAVGRWLQRYPRKKPKPKSTNETRADFVTAQVAAGRFKELEVPAPGGMGPPAPGGAFWMLNGLNPGDMLAVLRLCSKDIRARLIAHIAEADGRFDRPRLESALRSSAWGADSAGVAGLNVMDSVRTAGTGAFAPVWAGLGGKSRLALYAALRTLPRPMLTQLQGKLREAPAADQAKLGEVITDLLGTGTNMQANDVIDVQGLRGLDRTMASIYNQRGQLIQEQAAALGIPTDAAAAIMKVESGGATFNERTDKTIVRFENHVFWREWGTGHQADFNAHFDFDRGGQRWKQHRFRAGAAGPFENCHQNQEQEWRVMEFAATLGGQEAAYRSASWGAGQIMGFNSATVGFPTAVAMAAAFNKSERAQVTGIFEFIRANALAGAVRARDFLRLATRYNGAGQAPVYAANITAAADAYRRVTTGHVHVIP
jgi:hypothetical protein